MIRLAKKEDTSFINKLLSQINKIHHDGMPSIFKLANKYTDEELAQIIENSNETPIFVYTENDVVIGYAFLIIKEVKNNNILCDNKEIYIDDLCVDESYRGHGIGKALLKHVKEYAKEINANMITLNVWAFNDSARALYEKSGFKTLKTYMYLEEEEF